MLADEKRIQIQRQVIRHFEECARSYGTSDRITTIDGPIDSTFTFALARCIRTAVGEYADLVFQASNETLTPKLRRAILEEAFRFTGVLTDWPVLRRGLALAMRISVEETQLIPSSERKVFLKEVEGFRAEWMAEANRKVDLRRIMVVRPARSSPRPTGIKGLILSAIEAEPGASFRAISIKVDGYYERAKIPVPLPRSWARSGVTGLASAYGEPALTSRVKTYLSKIKKCLRLKL
ncbi:MAG: hypothetical protein WB630_01685 [Candidatus Acidiferrales bacterium]